MPPGHAHNATDSNPTNPDHDHKEGPARHAKPPHDLRLALVDRDEGTHLVVQDLLTTHARGWSLHSYRDTALALRGITAARPHVVLLELAFPGHSSIHCARKLKSLLPELPIVIFTARTDPDGTLQSLLAGACGYLIKPVEPENFFPAIARAAQGGLALCEKAERVLVNWFGRVAFNSQLEILTPRERELLPAILAGLSDKEISRLLPFATSTIHGYRTGLYKKFGADNCEELIKKFFGLDQQPSR